MKTTKTFDCLRMKENIQNQLHEEWSGLTPEQIRADIASFLAGSDNPVAVWWRSLDASGTTVRNLHRATLRPLPKPKKQFDCVKMKREIQAKMYRRSMDKKE